MVFLFQVYQKIDDGELAKEFWKNVMIISDQNLKQFDSSRMTHRHRDGINSSVKSDILKMFK